VQHRPSNIRISLQEVNARASTAHHIVVGFSRATPNLADLWQQITRSLSDIPILATEITELHEELTGIRLNRANLAAAGRATLAACAGGDPDPLSYLRDELAAQGFSGQWGYA
jgi:hypothetical protein